MAHSGLVIYIYSLPGGGVAPGCVLTSLQDSKNIDLDFDTDPDADRFSGRQLIFLAVKHLLERTFLRY